MFGKDGRLSYLSSTVTSNGFKFSKEYQQWELNFPQNFTNAAHFGWENWVLGEVENSVVRHPMLQELGVGWMFVYRK